MKTIQLAVIALLAGKISAQNTYIPSSTIATSGNIFGNKGIGVFMSNPPSNFPLEVGGGIGMMYGTYLGIAGTAWPQTQCKILQTGWQQVGAGGFDYTAFYTPGSTGVKNTVEKMRLTADGKVSIGAGAEPAAKLDVYQNDVFGTAQGSFQLLNRISGNYGSANSGSMYSRNTWLLRYGNQYGWDQTNIIDGISIDGSFNTPGSSTANLNPKTWWTRDAYWDSQQWGNDNKVHMSLDQGKFGVNINLSSQAVRGRLQVEETNGTIKAFVSKTTHGVGWGYCIVADVDHDNTHSLKVINRNFGAGTVPGQPAGQIQETFGVYGNGQTVISTCATDAFLIQDLMDSDGDNINFKVKKSGYTYCRELNVMTTAFPDYIFAKNHKLLSISDVKKYIAEHRRLPGFEAADYYEKNGINTSEMFVKQQEKIEELMLYVIQLEERLKAIEK